MPFESHNVLEPPKGGDAVIWRYFDFTKFVNMLDTGSLFFTRCDRFEDKFEGSYPKLNVSMRAKSFEEFMPAERARDMSDKLTDVNEKWRRFVAVNCWHINEHESAAMWRLYVQGKDGVAIRSSYKRLIDSLTATSDKVFVGCVKYIDYTTEWIPEHNMFYPFLHKRKSFEHERELRALVTRLPVRADNQGLDWTAEPIVAGMEIKVDLVKLIQAVYVSPESQPWFAQMVRSITRKLGYGFDVRQSDLDDGPVY